MLKKKLLPLAAAVTLTISLTGPAISSAGKLDDEIKDLRQEVKQKQKKQEDLKQQIKEVEKKEKSTEDKLSELEGRLEQTREKIRQLNNQITQTENELDEAKKQLKEAEERVEKRDKLFQERVRLMYENGKVTYLEVLFGASDFGDFLARFESIQMIAKQDKQLLEEQKRDRDIIAESKQEIETALAKLNDLQEEAEEQRKILAEQQQEQQVVLASLQEKHSELEEINEKEAQKERDLAAKLAAKVEEKKAREEEARRARERERRERERRERERQADSGPTPEFRDSGGTLAWPTSGPVTSGFGMRWGRMHNGIDIGAPGGTPIYAAADGRVTETGHGWNGGYGNQIKISHGNGITTRYAHIRNGGILVSPGEKVKRGQKIAEVGNTGNVRGKNGGYHLHFEVLEGGTPVNPMNYLK